LQPKRESVHLVSDAIGASDGGETTRRAPLKMAAILASEMNRAVLAVNSLGERDHEK
jgi:hypothetical protein